MRGGQTRDHRLNDGDHAARRLEKANDNRRAGRDPACIKRLRLCRTKKKALPNRRKKPAFLWSSHRMAKKSCDPKTLCKNSRYLPCFGNDRGIPPDPPHNAFLSGDGILLCQQFGKAAPPVFGNEALSEAPHLFREGSGDAPPDEALHHRQRDAAMAVGFFLMARKGIWIPCIILSIVWIAHILYFGFRVRTISDADAEPT